MSQKADLANETDAWIALQTRALLTSAHISIVATDDKGVIQLFNPGAAGISRSSNGRD